MSALAFLFLAVLRCDSAREYNESEAIIHMQLARVAFCTESAIESWTCGDMCDAIDPRPLQVRYLPRGTWWSVQGYVARLQENHCVLSFRGSVDVKNWAADLIALPRPWPWNATSWCEDCKAHAGFAHAYNELRSSVLEGLQDFNCRSVAVVGHSLGGGIATLAALDLRDNLAMNVHPVYTFGSPRVGNDALVNAFEKSARRGSNAPAQWRVVHYHDPVPHLPPMMGFGYAHTPTEIFYNADSSEYRVCDSRNGEDPTCSANIRARDLINLDHLDYLNKSFAHRLMDKACTREDSPSKDDASTVVSV